MAVGKKADGKEPRATSKAQAVAIKLAKESGLLPHEWLLKVARGEAVPHKQWKVKYDKSGNEISRELVEVEFYADFATRIDAAKAAAPYYAPRLASQVLNVKGGNEAVAKALADIAEKLPV